MPCRSRPQALSRYGDFTRGLTSLGAYCGLRSCLTHARRTPKLCRRLQERPPVPLPLVAPASQECHGSAMNLPAVQWPRATAIAGSTTQAASFNLAALEPETDSHCQHRSTLRPTRLRSWRQGWSAELSNFELPPFQLHTPLPWPALRLLLRASALRRGGSHRPLAGLLPDAHDDVLSLGPVKAATSMIAALATANCQSSSSTTKR